MFCQYPTTSLERDHPMGDATGTRKDRESTINQAHCSSRKAIRKAYNSIQDRFLRCPLHRQSQLNIGWSEEHCARLDDIAAEDHSHIATAAERARRENTWVLMLVSSAMNQREDCEENKKFCERPHQESGQAHHRLHILDKFDRDQTNHLLGRKYGAPRTKDKLEVVRHTASSKLCF